MESAASSHSTEAKPYCEIKAKHYKYCYALGICTATRNISEHLDDEKRCGRLEVPTEDLPSCLYPNRWEYEMVHNYTEMFPHCIYLLRHEVTEEASAKSVSAKFVLSGKPIWHLCVNKELFRFDVHIPDRYQELYDVVTSVTKSTKFIPFDTVLAGYEKMFNVVKMNMGQENIASVILLELGKQWEKLDQVAFEIDEELLLNQLFCSKVKGALTNLGFTVSKTLPGSQFCIFGKSQPDLCFYKCKNASSLKAEFVKDFYDKEEAVENEVAGSVIKFKISTEPEEFYPEMCANMVRIGSLLAQDALSRGQIINTIDIYGLLIVHGEKKGIPTKYYVNFKKNTCKFYIGELMDISVAMVHIAHILE